MGEVIILFAAAASSILIVIWLFALYRENKRDKDHAPAIGRAGMGESWLLCMKRMLKTKPSSSGVLRLLSYVMLLAVVALTVCMVIFSNGDSISDAAALLGFAFLFFFIGILLNIISFAVQRSRRSTARKLELFLFCLPLAISLFLIFNFDPYEGAGNWK
ncbi:MAG: hypothetical protein LBE59_09985 [Nevskiaceae bacterium]|nr:hypothetical protein [Nevskiaceae bacterium]